MRSLVWLPVLCVLLTADCLLSTGVALADDPEFSPKARARVTALEREIAQLKKENERLKAALNANGIVISDAHQSIVTILQSKSEELGPKKELDKFTLEPFGKWLKTEPVGLPFEAVLNVSHIKVRRTPLSQNPSVAWTVEVHFRSRDFRYGRNVFTQTVGMNWPRGLELTGDVEFAREMEGIRTGKQARVMGKIGSVQILPQSSTKQWKVNIALRDYEVEFLK
jgi:hypothetical protein